MSSTSSNKKNRSWIKYLIVTISCGIFSFIYEIFSHQVYSPFMVYLFFIPLVLGVIPSFIFKNQPSDPWQKTINSFAVATLIAGSALQGVMEIYGTTNNFINYFWIVGLILLAGSVILFIRDRITLSAG